MLAGALASLYILAKRSIIADVQFQNRVGFELYQVQEMNIPPG